MADSVVVELARLADRDRVLEVLREHGLDASALDDDERVALAIPCGGDAGRICDEVVRELESLVGEADIPLVPIEDGGRVFLRPPAD